MTALGATSVRPARSIGRCACLKDQRHMRSNLNHAKIASRPFLERGTGSAGIPTLNRILAKRSHERRAAACRAERADELTPREAALVQAVVDHMLKLGNGSHDRATVSQELYFDSAVVDGLGNSGGAGIAAPESTRRLYARGELGDLSPPLHRIGIATADRYCRRAFGRRFVDIPAVDRQAMLWLLDSVKLVYPDGSQAGLFFALVYQTAVKHDCIPVYL